MKKTLALIALLFSAAVAWGDTTTTRLGLTKPTIGTTGWGTKTNNNWDLVDSAVFGLSVYNTVQSSNTFLSTNTFSDSVIFTLSTATYVPFFSSGHALTWDPDFVFNGTTATITGAAHTNLSVSGTATISTVSATALIGTGLTSGRIALVGTGGVLQDDADFTTNGTTATLTGIAATNASISGNITTGLTASRAIVTDASSKLSTSAVTSTELGYVSGVTSAIQTQLNNINSKLVFIASATAVASSSITFTGLSSTYYRYLLIVDSHQPATNAQDQWVRISTNSGTTYQSNTGYHHASVNNNTAGTITGVGESGGTKFVIAQSLSNGATDAMSGEIVIDNPSQTASYHTVSWKFSTVSSAGVVGTINGSGKYLSSNALNAIQILSASGNITAGTYKLYGIAN